MDPPGGLSAAVLEPVDLHPPAPPHRGYLARFTILVVDAGLTPDGQGTVQALGRRDSTLLFCPAEEVSLILKRKNDHGYFSL